MPNQSQNPSKGPEHVNPDKVNQDRRDYDEFRETLATPVPNRTYRSQIDMIDSRPSALEQLIRYVAVVLGLLIAVRLVINLFITTPPRGFTSFIYSTTDWIVVPFQAIFGRPPLTNGGYFDWPAVAAIVVIAIIAALLVGLIRPRPEDN